jgi:thiosulfate dehydrogenase [quinone] large subunit
VLAEWALVPLRLFLGVTFLFAGLQKLSNPTFFNAKAPNSIQAQMAGSARFSPVHAMLTPLLHYAATIGYTIAFGEVAIGLGIVVGLWTRAAAIGGALLSFMLFLTVSFHASPYFTGADIVFFFAWMPFIVAGGGSRLSLDGWIARRAAREQGQTLLGFVPIEFALVQRMCGNFSDNTCRARRGAPCDAAFCPVLIGERAPLAARGATDAVDRRALVMGGVAAAVAGASAVALGFGSKVIGARLNHSSASSSSGGQLSLGSTTTTTTPPTTTTTAHSTTTTHAGQATTTTTTPPTTTTTAAKNQGTLLGRANQISVGKPATFSVPSNGDPAIVFELAANDYVAYDTVCPHAGCTVQYAGSADVMICPCHGSQFEVKTGNVLNGPAPHGLTKLDVYEGNDGNLYYK